MKCRHTLTLSLLIFYGYTMHASIGDTVTSAAYPRNSVQIPKQDYDALCAHPTIEFVYIPSNIKKVLIRNMHVMDATRAHELHHWLVEQAISVVPRILIEEIIAQLSTLKTLSLKEQRKILWYQKNIERGDATIIPVKNELPTRGHNNQAFCNLFVRRMLRANDLYVCDGATIEGNLQVNGTIFGIIHPQVQGPQGLQGPQGPQGPQGFPGTIFGNVVRVDKVDGNDATGQRHGNPFLTINAALAAALPGDACWIFPGTYDESFTIPDGIAVIGLTTGAVTINKTVAVATDLVTMGANTRLENVNLSLKSSSHVQLRGIVFPGTTTATAKIRTLVLKVDNSTADIGGSSNVYGIHSPGTGTPGDEISACRASTIEVKSIGGGIKRGLLVDSASHFHARDSNFMVTSAGGGGSYIGAETNHASAVITFRTSTSSGDTADISQTLGTFNVITTDLLHATANGLSFSTKITPSILIWAEPGTLPTGTNFLRPGSETASSSEIFVRIGQPLIAKSLNIRARVAATLTPATFTVRKNGVDTLLAATLPIASTSATNSTTSVSFTTGDAISLKVVRAAGGGPAQDVVVVVDLY